MAKNVYEAANFINSANSSYRSGLTDKAIGQLKMALKYDPSFAAAHANLGVLLARQGKNEEALKQLKAATECPDPPDCVYGALASMYQSTGRLGEAIDTYQRFLEHAETEGDKKTTKAIIELLTKERERQKTTGTGEAEKDYFVNAQGQYVTKSFWTQWHMPLKVYIDPDLSDVDSYSPNYDTLLKQAFSDWSKASNEKITFHFVNSKDDCDIDCKWVGVPEQLGSGSEDGHCDSLSAAGAMAHASITILCASRDAFPMTENNILNTCRHEVGHALGIGWHSANPQDVMYFSSSIADQEKTISPRDAATLSRLYSSELSAPASLLDFLRCSKNWQKYFPLAFLLLVMLVFTYLLRLLLKKQNGKKRKK